MQPLCHLRLQEKDHQCICLRWMRRTVDERNTVRDQHWTASRFAAWKLTKWNHRQHRTIGDSGIDIIRIRETEIDFLTNDCINHRCISTRQYERLVRSKSINPYDHALFQILDQPSQRSCQTRVLPSPTLTAAIAPPLCVWGQTPAHACAARNRATIQIHPAKNLEVRRFACSAMARSRLRDQVELKQSILQTRKHLREVRRVLCATLRQVQSS